MRRGWGWLVVLGLAAMQSSLAERRYWQDRSAGWFWYELPPPPLEAEPLVPLVDPAAPAPAPEAPPEVAAHEKLATDLEQARSVAIMSPTPANVHAYLLLQREVMERSSVFADVFQRVVWASPELDYQFRHRPLNSLALRSWDAAKQREQDELIARAAQSQGLFFVFGPGCIHCAQMAATLERLARRHGLVVQAIATDGASHPSFPGAWPDNGFVAAAKLAAVPALALASVDPADPKVVVVGYGALAATEIERRIAVLTGVEVGARF